MNETEPDSLSQLKRSRRRLDWINKIRPQSLATPLYKLLAPYERRMIVQYEGLRLYLDPVSNLGRSISHGSFEPETFNNIRKHLRPGGVYLDIGANEGIFSALAASIVGPSGCVIALKPQSRLQDIININIALNATVDCEFHLFRNAIDVTTGNSLRLSLFPVSNTGASGIVRRYRWNLLTETVETLSVTDLVAQAGLPSISLVKIDVEGYEPEVVSSLAPLLKSKRIGTLLVDYHAIILRDRNINLNNIHRSIIDFGYEIENGELFGGYVTYISGKVL